MHEELKAVESPVEILRAMEAAASPAPWKPNCVFESEDSGGWGTGPLCKPSTPEEIQRYEDGDWDTDDQMELAREDAELIAHLRNLAPGLIALWDACNARITSWGGLETNMLDSQRIIAAVEDLNAKAATPR